MPALDILGLEIDDILGLDILVHMPTFDIPADVLADFSILDMPALDILDLEIDDFLVLDILVHMPTFDTPADVLADFSILDMPALDILGLCFQAAAVGSPVCLMLVYSIPAAAVPLA